ncbi:hypothetical protein SJZ84_11450 [Hafnia paralvei]|uniref:hypothetical protein n=1 Tax=Hafnia paralvei TaxID=546367 RepID=UPI0001F0615B|nr:hypothetical protein [Hafnia paralvei]EFV38994.1 hypothetical protein HMPREF0864_03583 [Enterobacteriaceae bacterium 9_2_54FAA]MCE9902637.1 hypothetical protein [Hafnia paralvei]MCE9919120.1 hypothetical protein [Hafnia paralvei]MDX6911441.1 hypothetical protein [Hafnia paralvei]TBM26735.1 hypothetical protein EYY85_10560 [Hafnia paralvei]
MKINSGALEPLICWLCMLSPRRFYFVLLAACLICLIGGRLGLTALAQWMESSTWTAKNGAEMHQERMIKDVLSQRTLLLKISVDTLLLKPLATQCTDLPVGERFAQQINWQKDKNTQEPNSGRWQMNATLNFTQLMQLIDRLAQCARPIMQIELHSEPEMISGQLLVGELS